MPVSRGNPPGLSQQAALMEDVLRRVASLERASNTGSYVSQITAWAGAGTGKTPPGRNLVCDGSEKSRITYADLFAEIGTKYGAGDGSTTFNLPGQAAAGALLSSIPATQNTRATNLASGSNSANHTHSGNTGNESAVHSHAANEGNPNANHSHGVSINSGNVSANHTHNYFSGPSGAKATSNFSANHYHAVVGNTGNVSAWHTHTISVGNESANHGHAFSSGNQSANHTHSFGALDVTFLIRY